MKQKQRVVAGLRCGEVLELLSAYLDGELDEMRRRQIEQHVAGCDLCERFGASFASTVRALRTYLGAASPLNPELSARLAERLRSEAGRGRINPSR